MKTVYGNTYDKYNSKNPIARVLMNGFLASFFSLVPKAYRFQKILEIGCADGDLALRLIPRLSGKPLMVGLDPGLDEVLKGHLKAPSVRFCNGTIYSLPFADRVFDLVLLPEVLEHLENPEEGLREALRVGSEHFILSVPREPLWCIGNFFSGRYMRQLGNTPGHVQHWSTRTFLAFVSRFLDIKAVKTPFPWTIVHAVRKLRKG